jgi:hypothetical protein
MESEPPLDVVIGKGPPVLQQLASKDQHLLIRKPPIFVLN